MTGEGEASNSVYYHTFVSDPLYTVMTPRLIVSTCQSVPFSICFGNISERQCR